WPHELREKAPAPAAARGLRDRRPGALAVAAVAALDRLRRAADRARRGPAAVGDGPPPQERLAHHHRALRIPASPALLRDAPDRARLPDHGLEPAGARARDGLRRDLLRLLHAVQGPDRERAAREPVRRRIPALRGRGAAADPAPARLHTARRRARG